MSNPGFDRLSWIFGRRSIRQYSPGEIGPEEVEAMLEAAMAAPSAMTKDPWRFVVIRQSQTLARLAAILPGGKMLSTAALAIVVCGDQEAALDCQLSYLLQDCSAATENLLLAAHCLGLGGCWVGVHPAPESVQQLSELLGLPAKVIPIAAVALGRPAEQPEARTRFDPQSVHLEKW